MEKWTPKHEAPEPLEARTLLTGTIDNGIYVEDFALNSDHTKPGFDFSGAFHEVLSSSVLETITVMVRLPNGAFPLGGDYWYGATDPEGNVKTSDDGAPLVGLLQNCGTCHLRRSHDAFLFGTPRAYLP